MTIRVAVIGNCQAQLLENILMQAVTDIAVDRFIPTFEMTDNMELEVTQRLAAADIVFAQRVSESFHLSWLTPTALRQQLGSKAVIWPNIYFDGYSPGVRYIYLDGWGKLQGPLEDYHLKQVVDAYKEGLSAEDAANALTTVETKEAEQESFAISLAELRSREMAVDVPISDFIDHTAINRRCMYTPNHPFNFVLAEMGRRLSKHFDLLFDKQAASKYEVKLDRIYIPTFPWVRHHYGLRFDSVNLYRGINVEAVTAGSVMFGKPRSFVPADLVAQFYRVYDVALASQPESE